jgi:D-3-phosphoglycerate dehydrogenase
MKVLANDGISKSGIRKGGFEVITAKVAQEQVANYVNENNVDVVLV